MNYVPTVSVLMPVYNAQKYVAQAIESILHQTFTDFELLIVDDGSSDRSFRILKRYAAHDSRIRLLSRPNKGFVKTLNEMIPLANGDLIARMDADDLSLPDRFAHQVEFLRQHPEVVCVGGFQDWIDEAGRILIDHQEAIENAEIQAQLLTGRTAINHPSAMMRRSALLQVGGYDESMYPAEDLDLWLRLGEIGKLANLPETVVYYRQHSRSISEQKQAEQTAKRRQACERAWQRRGIVGHFVEGEPWRPVDRPSRHRFMLRYGWWFFNTGQRYAAIVYGLRAIHALPAAIDGWKLLACALIKRLPDKPLPEPNTP
ncbi:MAG: glycosyltransferase [Cyanobacteria bacterium CRU_2_1]|nr:glycosyltransferase [Cyanobacteria bacterium CRU_2_1]